jgi:hypothetical protein
MSSEKKFSDVFENSNGESQTRFFSEKGFKKPFNFTLTSGERPLGSSTCYILVLLIAHACVSSVGGSIHTNKKNSNDFSAYVKCFTRVVTLNTLNDGADLSYVAIIKSFITPCLTFAIAVLLVAILRVVSDGRAPTLAPSFLCRGA